MTCYSPLTAWRGPVLASGKRSVVFKPSESTAGLSAFPQKLPCGQCIGCRLDYSLDWANRIMCEAQMHKENCFVTLTYDVDHLPKDQSLHKRDWQLFVKRLRKQSGKKIRYYHAGEYGERFGRPHYHAVLFGVDFEDKRFFKKTGSGCSVYTSDNLSGLWNKGYCSIGEVTFESAAYVARYCLKKVTGKNKEVVDARGLRHYDRVDESTGEVYSLVPEYVTMSRGRRPDGGIGYTWYQKYKSDIYPHGYSMIRAGVKTPPPRYFDNLYEVDNLLDMKRLKLHRVARSVKKEDVWNDKLQKFQRLFVNRDDRLSVMEEVKERQLSACRKKLESGL